MIGEFGATQLGVQALTALASLIIVRSLSKQEYALFAIANSIQTTCNVLADCGIGVRSSAAVSGTIVSVSVSSWSAR